MKHTCNDYYNSINVLPVNAQHFITVAYYLIWYHWFLEDNKYFFSFYYRENKVTSV